MTRTVRVAWSAMGTPAMVRLITIGMVVYALVIGALGVGYVRVQSCVADYANANARRTGQIAAVTDRSSQAQIDLADALARAEDIGQVRVAANRWSAALRDQERVRAELPPPPPPSEDC